jgi:hypothetical protein
MKLKQYKVEPSGCNVLKQNMLTLSDPCIMYCTTLSNNMTHKYRNTVRIGDIGKVKLQSPADVIYFMSCWCVGCDNQAVSQQEGQRENGKMTEVLGTYPNSRTNEFRKRFPCCGSCAKLKVQQKPHTFKHDCEGYRLLHEVLHALQQGVMYLEKWHAVSEHYVQTSYTKFRPYQSIRTKINLRP